MGSYPGLHRGSGFTKKINLKSCPQWLHLIPGISFSGISVKSAIISWMNDPEDFLDTHDNTPCMTLETLSLESTWACVVLRSNNEFKIQQSIDVLYLEPL